jgi:hypothetical protein
MLAIDVSIVPEDDGDRGWRVGFIVGEGDEEATVVRVWLGSKAVEYFREEAALP